MDKYKFFIIAVLYFLSIGCSTKTDSNVKVGKITKSLDYVINKKISSDNYSKVKGYMPKEGLLPTAEIAFQIAEPILANVYGQELIDQEKPFSINLENNIWIIEGHIESGVKGGVAYMEIRKSNGEILKIIHTE